VLLLIVSYGFAAPCFVEIDQAYGIKSTT